MLFDFLRACSKQIEDSLQESVKMCLALEKEKLEIYVCPVQSVIQFLDEKT